MWEVYSRDEFDWLRGTNGHLRTILSYHVGTSGPSLVNDGQARIGLIPS
jgi:hypothetical protein